MANGWAGDDAVQQQIDASVQEAVERARAQLPEGASRESCADCGAEIPLARREALPGVRLCVGCQAVRDEERTSSTGYNRRGSKDSQLR